MAQSPIYGVIQPKSNKHVIYLRSLTQNILSRPRLSQTPSGSQYVHLRDQQTNQFQTNHRMLEYLTITITGILCCIPFNVVLWEVSAKRPSFSSDSSSSIVCVTPMRGKVTCSRCG